MKKLVAIISLWTVATAFTTIDLWKNDKAHSQLGFTVTHLGISDVSVTFNDFDVTVQSNKEDFSDAVFELSAKVASIDTRVEARNNHLKSPDFFNAEKYPEIKFKSTAIKKSKKNQYALSGNLTMHGVTKPVTLKLIYRGTTTNPMSNATTVGFQLTGTIKRSDFTIGNSFPNVVIGDEVLIKADGEFTK